jgi:4-amino-4-deoxy-L-arabinose transferase-like glycosyltransferase
VAAVAVGLVVRLCYALITHDNALRGDALEYDMQGAFFADGHAWWSRTPFGIPHPSLWKAPLYPLWVGAVYSVFGAHPAVAIFLQVGLGAVVIVLTWVLAGRLFGPRAAAIAAFAVALYPLAFQYWNGINRTLGVRLPWHGQDEVRFDGRVKWVSLIGAWCYVAVALAALAGLWRHRRRRGLVLAVLALLLATAVVYTGDGGTRYRAPLEPLLVVMAAAAFVPVARAGRSGTRAAPGPVSAGAPSPSPSPAPSGGNGSGAPLLPR